MKKKSGSTVFRCHICREEIDLEDITEDPRNEVSKVIAENDVITPETMVVHVRHQGVIAAFERMRGKAYPPLRESTVSDPSSQPEVLS